MRLHFAVVLAVATCVAMTTAAVETKTVAASDSVPSLEKDVSTRHLRTITESDEERGVIPGVEAVVNLFKSPSQKRVEKLAAESGNNAEKAFKLLNFGKADDILSNPDFQVWSKLVAKLNKRYAHSIVLSKLQDIYKNDHNLAQMLEKAMLVKGTKKTAKKLKEVLTNQVEAKRHHKFSFQD